MSDLIRREDAIKALMAEAKEQFRLDPSYAYVIGALRNVEDAIRNIPSADRPQGKWLLKDNVFHCGCCGKESHFTADDVYVYDMPLPDFCEKCGARLKGADDETDRCRCDERMA